ncbi:MAG TPA: hypothetical protein VJW96_11490 [Terriglobales bacterium]|jgi:hypothetical protein|nr:hypothetical protein [Terriglobales bacterium]
MLNVDVPVETLARKLRQIKLLHTAIWAIMAASILALPWAGWVGQFRWAFGLTLLILGECLVLGLNRGRCPLTDMAARYTDDRTDNFDIYLPLWLARYNKSIFGFLFLVGELVVLWRWARRPGL